MNKYNVRFEYKILQRNCTHESSMDFLSEKELDDEKLTSKVIEILENRYGYNYIKIKKINRM